MCNQFSWELLCRVLWSILNNLMQGTTISFLRCRASEISLWLRALAALNCSSRGPRLRSLYPQCSSSHHMVHRHTCKTPIQWKKKSVWHTHNPSILETKIKGSQIQDQPLVDEFQASLGYIMSLSLKTTNNKA